MLHWVSALDPRGIYPCLTPRLPVFPFLLAYTADPQLSLITLYAMFPDHLGRTCKIGLFSGWFPASAMMHIITPGLVDCDRLKLGTQCPELPAQGGAKLSHVERVRSIFCGINFRVSLFIKT